MVFSLRTVAAAAALTLAASSASAVLVGSIEHQYGSASGRQLSSVMGIYHPGGNCDTRSGCANLHSALSGNSGRQAGPRRLRREGVFDGQEISAPYAAHP